MNKVSLTGSPYIVKEVTFTPTWGPKIPEVFANVEFDLGPAVGLQVGLRIQPPLWKVIKDVGIPFAQNLTVSVEGHFEKLVPGGGSGNTQLFVVVDKLEVLGPQTHAKKFQGPLWSYDSQQAMAVHQVETYKKQTAEWQQQVAKLQADLLRANQDMRDIAEQRDALDNELRIQRIIADAVGA